MAATSQPILVLGQHLNKDQTAPPTLLKRLEHAARLYQHAPAPIIVTGGDPSKIGKTEAVVMRDVLVSQHGVPESAVVIEDQAPNTSANATYCRDIVRRLGDSGSAIAAVRLVTSDFHMPRSALLFATVFATLGLPVVECPSESGLPVDDLPRGEAPATYFEINCRGQRSRLELERYLLASSVRRHIQAISPPVAMPADADFASATAKVQAMLDALPARQH